MIDQRSLGKVRNVRSLGMQHFTVDLLVPDHRNKFVNGRTEIGGQSHNVGEKHRHIDILRLPLKLSMAVAGF